MAKRYESPLEQEAAHGNEMLCLAPNVYLEVGPFREEPWVSIRKWYLAGDGVWARSNNGVSLPINDAKALLASLNDREVMRFALTRAQAMQAKLDVAEATNSLE